MSAVLLSACEGGFKVRAGQTARVFQRYEDAYRHARSLGQRVLDEAQPSLLGVRVRFTPSPGRAEMGGVGGRSGAVMMTYHVMYVIPSYDNCPLIVNAETPPPPHPAVRHARHQTQKNRPEARQSATGCTAPFGQLPAKPGMVPGIWRVW
jgi:hypothetical protein